MVDLVGMFRPRQTAGHPDYFLDSACTPDTGQINSARVRWRGRRDWWGVPTDAEMEALRISILFATETSNDDPKDGKGLRRLRQLAFDDGSALFFTRPLSISPLHYLIEFRHPKLNDPSRLFPTGIRFIALNRDRWQHSDSPIGVLVDGKPLLFNMMFRSNGLNLQDEGQVESYVEFVFRHMEMNDEQIYLVSDKADFIDASQQIQVEDPATLVAQFHKDNSSANLAQGAGQQARPANMPPDSHLIPPTYLRAVAETDGTPAHALVFATVIYRGGLHHVCLQVMADGSISCKKRRSQTAEGTRLPIIPLRSFVAQRASIAAAVDNEARVATP